MVTASSEQAPARPVTDPLQLAADLPLSEEESGYVAAARAPNTLRGYRSDWAEFSTWCAQHRRDPLPATAATISGYLTDLARAGPKVGTMSRRLSAIRFAHRCTIGPIPPPALGSSRSGRVSVAPTAHPPTKPPR